MLDPRERHRFSLRTPGPAVPTRAYQPRHNASTTAACAPPTETSRPANAGLKAVQLDKPHSISADGHGRQHECSLHRHLEPRDAGRARIDRLGDRVLAV